jgi:hypothetical protein
VAGATAVATLCIEQRNCDGADAVLHFDGALFARVETTAAFDRLIRQAAFAIDAGADRPGRTVRVPFQGAGSACLYAIGAKQALAPLEID